MYELLAALIGALIGAFRPRACFVAENLALRQQLAVLRRKKPRPRLVPIDRAFWILLSRIWPDWADVLALVKPETVIAWHREGSLVSGPGSRGAAGVRR
jgi:putative transposase